MLDNLLALLKARLRNIHIGITTGDWTPAREDIKQNIQEYKHLYIGLTILIIIYVFLEVYYPCCNWKLLKTKQQNRIKKQTGGAGNNTPPPEPPKTAQPASAAEPNKTDPRLLKSQLMSSSSGIQSAGGLCSGNGFFSKICQGAGSGISSIFKFIGMIFLGILLLLAPPLIYIMLVYIVLKLMFKGLRGM